ncbi:MAG: thermonuclease family protein [Candidatus Caldarchaeum sp.]
MTWAGHTLVGIAVGQVTGGDTVSFSLAVLGALAPDLAEKLTKIPHRTITHNVLLAILLLIIATAFSKPLLPFAIGVMSHIALDSLNAFGVPIWKEKRITTFWGRVRNGTIGEWIATIAVALGIVTLVPVFQAYELTHKPKFALPFGSVESIDIDLDVPAWAQTEEKIKPHQVADIHDGDTMRLKDGRRIRFLGIDAPELNQEYGKASRDELREIVRNSRELSLRCEKTDKYGRHLCWVYADGKLVQEMLVERGLAVVFMCMSEECRKLELAEDKAKTSRAGFWRQGGLKMLPSEFRRLEK